MNEVSDYTQPAEECRAMAAKTKDYEIGRKLIAMARAWEFLARDCRKQLERQWRNRVAIRRRRDERGAPH